MVGTRGASRFAVKPKDPVERPRTVDCFGGGQSIAISSTPPLAPANDRSQRIPIFTPSAANGGLTTQAGRSAGKSARSASSRGLPTAPARPTAIEGAVACARASSPASPCPTTWPTRFAPKSPLASTPARASHPGRHAHLDCPRSGGRGPAAQGGGRAPLAVAPPIRGAGSRPQAADASGRDSAARRVRSVR